MRNTTSLLLLWCVIFGAIALLVWLPKPTTPAPIRWECSVTHSYPYLQDGWKIMDPSDRQTVGILVGKGKAEQTTVDNLVECTRYQDHTTPVTKKYALVMWRMT